MNLSPRHGSVLAACALLPLLLLLAGRADAQNTNTGQRTTPGGSVGGTGSNNQQRAGTGGASAPNSSSASSTRTYRNNTQLGDALIQIDPESRSLIIVADEDTDREISKTIKNLDQPKPQVLIKVLFAQVTLDNNSDIGVEGSYHFNTGSAPVSDLLTTAVSAATGTSAASTSSTTTTSPSSTITTSRTNPLTGTTTMTTTSNVPYTTNTAGSAGPATNFGLSSATTGGFFTLDTKYATATLYALAQKGKVAVLSRPSILARNNQEAVILVGQSVPIPSGNVISDTGANSTSVTYQDVGIILRVTPYITTGKNIEMIVSPEISSLSTQTVQISQNFNAPIINKTSAETVVVTPDQTTVVIGGLMQKTDSTQINKVPLLGDIPFVGNAFKRTTKTSNKTELVIFLTPYIVEGTDQLEDLSVEDVNRTDLPKEGFTPTDVSQFLDNNLTLFPQPTPGTTKTVTTRKTTTTQARKATSVEK